MKKWGTATWETMSFVSSTVLQVNSSKWDDVWACICWELSKTVGLTCRFGSEFVPVGSTYSQQPVAQVQVKPLLSSDATHHLGKEQWIVRIAAVLQAQISLALCKLYFNPCIILIVIPSQRISLVDSLHSTYNEKLMHYLQLMIIFIINWSVGYFN